MRTLAKALAGFTLAALLSLATPGVALAQGAIRATCDSKIIDATSSQVLDTEAVSTAIAHLENTTGADVRVRAFEAAPFGSLDTYYKQEVTDCASWSTINGVPKGNLVVLLFSMDRKSSLFYGSNWHTGLDNGVADGIRNDYMNANFRSGDFTRGITSALDRTASVLNEQLHPAPPTDYGNLVKWMVIGIGSIVAFVVLLFGGREGRRSFIAWRERAKRLAKSKQAAIDAQSAADAAYTQLISVDNLKAEAMLASAGLNLTDSRQLEERVTEAYRLIEDADGKIAALNVRPDFKSAKKLTSEDYAAILRDYRDAKDSIDRAVDAVASFRARCEECKQLSERSPQDQQALEARLAAMHKRNDALKLAGYHVTFDAELTDLGKTVTATRGLVDAEQQGMAIGDIRDASATCDKLEGRLSRIENILDRLTTSRAELMQRYERASSGVDNLRARTRALAADFNASCIQKLMTIAQGLPKDLKSIDAFLSSATSAMTMQSQRWDDAEQNLSKTANVLDRLEHSVSEGSSQADALQLLPAAVAQQLSTTSSNLSSLLVEVESMKGDQESHLRQLRRLEKSIRRHRAALQEPKPDYIQLGVEIGNVSDEIASIRKSANDVDTRAKRVARSRNSGGSSSGGSTTIISTGGYDYGGSFGGSSGGSDYGGGSSGGWSGGSDFGGGSSGSW